MTKFHVPSDDSRIPMNYIDVQRQTKTSIDVLQEATSDDYWNMDGDKPQSESWNGVTRFPLLKKNPPAGYVWVQGRLTKKQVPTRPGHTWPNEWSDMSKGPQREAIKNGLKQNQNLTLRENNEAFTSLETMILIVNKS